MSKTRVVLIILDGWGIGPEHEGNAIMNAKTPTMDMLTSVYPHTELQASGEAVGLPRGEDGNTETGHLNIGAGRVVYQDLPRINMAIANGSFFENKAFLKAIEHTKAKGSNLHLLGLIGQGGVHSSNDHLYALMRLAKQQSIDNLYLHLITDGRDSPPTSASMYLAEVIKEIEDIGVGKISTVMGRYYGMDRDHRWERTKVAYDALVDRVGETTSDLIASVNARHAKQENDEFLRPIISDPTGIRSDDAVIFFNYRIDRPRQLTKALVLDDTTFAKHTDSFDPYAIKYQPSHLTHKKETDKIFPRPNLPQDLLFVTMTEYEKDLPVEIAYPAEFVEMPLSRVLALAGRRQLKLSESEKERFVTYYFNGQRELKFPGEDVDITPSPKVPTYDLQPDMSGLEQTTKLIKAIRSNLYDLIVINYANPDMVAHTGNYEATRKACEFTDSFIKQIYQVVIQHEELVMLITADHGNAEELINLESGGVDTEHSHFPVPFLLIGKRYHGNHTRLKRGALSDIAPTILKLLELRQPASMTGHSVL